ncbi:hypothetical protein [Nannocystis radixulma]|uniref:Uncharacterized protein n=1 Tax=Nannocystis radixulma TaxID=2995305 RepID=A0ABT5AY53_9BACT|nr:hypothetical protein [Nannocystis radixulma]MDC0666194.1 hypothetical protein [Nannocystis radixulma]
MEKTARIAEIEGFIRFVATEWPRLRADVAHQISARCTRCILSEHCSPLVDGVCEVCRSGGQSRRHPAREIPAMTRALDELLRAHAGRGRGRHDALLLFSGGKDSAYLLHRLRTEYPDLRILALTVESGFFSAVARDNVDNILRRIGGVDHVTFTPRGELFRKTFRHALTHLAPGGCYETVDRMDGDLTFDIGRNVAAELDIPLMIIGLSPIQVEDILGLSSFETDPAVERQRRTTSAGFELERLYTAEELRFWWDGTRWPDGRIPRVLYPFYAWEYDEHAIREEVLRLGLIEPGQDDPIITNNDLIPIMLALDVAVLGYSGFEPEFAQLVRTGKADRAMWLGVFEALEYLARRGEFLPNCIASTLGRLELSVADIGLRRAVPAPIR